MSWGLSPAGERPALQTLEERGLGIQEEDIAANTVWPSTGSQWLPLISLPSRADQFPPSLNCRENTSLRFEVDTSNSFKGRRSATVMGDHVLEF